MRQCVHSWGNVSDEDDLLNQIARQLENNEISPEEAVLQIETMEAGRNAR